MRKGYCKKKIMTAISGLVFLSMVLCGCDSSVGKTSEHNSTESITESNVPESSTSSEGRREEEFPFDGMENLTCHEYDEENILGLSAIYVGEKMLVFCFQRNDIWRDYEENNTQIDIDGIDEQGFVVDIASYSMAESSHFFWVHIEKDKEGETAGFGVSDHAHGYSIYGLKETRLGVQEWDTNILERQVYENDHWGEVIRYDLGPMHVPN